MAISSVLLQTFYNLALFICHLTNDGHFQYGHILYDPKVFDDSFITRIDSVCEVKIPWQISDITKTISPTHQEQERTDHILQLIFFDPKYLAQQIDEYKTLLSFYRIFVFTSNYDDIETKKGISVFEKLSPILDSSPSILQYNPNNDTVNLHTIYIWFIQSKTHFWFEERAHIRSHFWKVWDIATDRN